MNDRTRLVSRKRSFIADQRGAVALEMPIVYLFLMFSLLLPLADVGIAGFQYISAWQALRAFGQYVQYNPPADVTNTSSWSSSALAKVDPSYPISGLQVICGDGNAACSTTNTVSPKYYSYTTSVTLAPMVLKSVLCKSANTNPCTYTLPYSERFQ
jgi:Flp pilus assembly protein TadG